MSNAPKPPRTTQAIQQDYQNLAFRAGNLQYEIKEKNKDLDMINSSMRDLNFEFIAAKKTEDAVAAAKAETPPPAPADPATVEAPKPAKKSKKEAA